MSNFKTLIALSAVAFLAACGGGGDSGTSSSLPNVTVDNRVTFNEDFSNFNTGGGFATKSPLVCEQRTDGSYTGFATNLDKIVVQDNVTGTWAWMTGTEDWAPKYVKIVGNKLTFNYSSTETVKYVDEVDGLTKEYINPNTMGPYYHEGFALLSKQTVNKNKDLLASAVMSLENDDRAFAGLTLLYAESNYREIALTVQNGKLHVAMYAPCKALILQTVEFGKEYELGLKKTAAGWSYQVNGKEVFFENMEADGVLVGDPRLGLYIVNELKNKVPVRGTYRNVRMLELN